VNVPELKIRLREEGLSPDVYSINGPLPVYEGLLLEESAGKWRILHFERGMRREMESYAEEEQACKRMYELLMEYFG
jgi:hypothetical protein